MTYYPPNTPETRNPLIVSTIFGVLALLSFLGRVYDIYLRSSRLKIDEWLITAALILVYASLGLQWACVVHGGTGRHTADVAAVDPSSVVLTLKLILPFEALYGVTLALVKLAVLGFYNRTFAFRKWFKVCLWITAVSVILWMISVILETFLLCRPLAYNWDSTIEGTCGNRNVVYVTAGITNMVTDFMVLLLPVPAIWRLKMPIGQKVGLVALFSMGIFITAISIVRLFSLMAISFTDPLWTLPMGLLWTVLEPELVIINANLPFLRRYLVQIVPRAFMSTPRSKGYPTKGSKHADFKPINENGIMLQTIGGGYIHRSDIAARSTESKSSSRPERFKVIGIVQERSVRVEYGNADSDEVTSKADSQERIV